MIIKIGKKLLTLSLFYTAFLSSSLSLNVTNTLNIPLTSINVGVPFLVTVTAKDLPELNRWPTFDSLDKLHIVKQQMETKRIMDSPKPHNERRFIYTVVADTSGTLTIGPAQAGNSSSNTQVVTIIEGKYPAKSNSLLPTYTLSIPHNRYVVGEKVPFTVKFAVQRQDIRLRHLEPLDVDGLNVTDLNVGEAKVETNNNELISVIEYRGHFYPTKTGELFIPPLRADYTVPSEKRNSFASFFLIPHEKTYAVYTHPLKLIIDPLPKTDLPIGAIGEFTSYTATLNSKQALRGEALLLTIALEGTSDFESIAVPKLTLPENLRVYESKSALYKTAQGEKKEWEFIIQGLKEGTYTIGKQIFYYFDTKTKTYRNITTKNITITILPGAPPQRPKEDTPKEKSLPSESLTDEIPLHTKAPELELPWWLFLTLLSIPVFFTTVWLLLPLITPRFQKMFYYIRRKTVLSHALKNIQSAQKSNNIPQLYEITKKAMIDYLSLPENSSSEDISKALRAQGFSNEFQQEWIKHHTSLATISIYSPSHRTERSAHSFSQARAWIQHLSKAPRILPCIILTFSACPFMQAELSPALYDIVETMSQGTLYIPFIVWQLGALATWTLCWYYAAFRNQKAFLKCLILFIFAGTGWGLRGYQHYRPSGYIRTDEALLYLGPDKTHVVRGKLHKGEKITVAQKKGLWYYVFSAEGRGWVKAEEVSLETRL